MRGLLWLLGLWLSFTAIIIAASSCSPSVPAPAKSEQAASTGVAEPPSTLDLGISSQAARIHMNALVVDGHADRPQRLLFDTGFDLGARHGNGNVDVPRMREGGLDAQFCTEALLENGYSEQDVAKILGGNILRVMERVDAVSRELF